MSVGMLIAGVWALMVLMCVAVCYVGSGEPRGRGK